MNLETLKSRVRTEEGWRPRVYDDATGAGLRPGYTLRGHPTVGYGFALDVAELPKEIAEAWLHKLTVRVHGDLQLLIPFWATLDEVRQVALAEIAYQMGVTGLLTFQHALQALAVGDAERAAEEFRASKWAREQSPARAERVIQMIRTGTLPEGSCATRCSPQSTPSTSGTAGSPEASHLPGA